jgi:hypothetical protein
VVLSLMRAATREIVSRGFTQLVTDVLERPAQPPVPVPHPHRRLPPGRDPRGRRDQRQGPPHHPAARHQDRLSDPEVPRHLVLPRHDQGLDGGVAQASGVGGPQGGQRRPQCLKFDRGVRPAVPTQSAPAAWARRVLRCAKWRRLGRLCPPYRSPPNRWKPSWAAGLQFALSARGAVALDRAY